MFQHPDIDHYKVKVRDEAVMNHMAPNVESVVAEIHWFVQEWLEMTELKQEMAMTAIPIFLHYSLKHPVSHQGVSDVSSASLYKPDPPVSCSQCLPFHTNFWPVPPDATVPLFSVPLLYPITSLANKHFSNLILTYPLSRLLLASHWLLHHIQTP